MAHHLEPGGTAGRTRRDRIYTFSIVSTGRCNVACTYCHYYLSHDRKKYRFDMSDELADTYFTFIAAAANSLEGTVNYRFTGGDPMVLGDRLFELADRGYQATGIKPFMLTAGKKLNETWAKKAQRSALSHAMVSIENPIRPDRGAPDPLKVVEAMRRLSSDEFPIVPGVCVVPNDCFGNLYEICSWFYERLGSIPSIAEINYGAYKSPTESEWGALEHNLRRVISEFAHKTPLSLFGSVSPELTFGGRDAYICDLDIDNSYGMTPNNCTNKLEEVLLKLREKNYPSVRCNNTVCPWWDCCDNTKWFWRNDGVTPQNVKHADYCRFKRLMNDVYFSVLVDPSHLRTITSIAFDPVVIPG